jgi:fructan beta-fructosidase
MIKVLAFLMGIWILSSCSSSTDNASESANNLTDSLYRPAFHFSPKQNWMGAPISMTKHNDEYHLFYEYNTDGKKANHNSWGHAVSSDMLAWKEWQPIFLDSDDRQGSVVSDVENTSGFGENALIAIHNEDDEIMLSYSLDNGVSWTDYKSPLLELSGIPKVSRSTDSDQWVMTLLENTKLTFFSSNDLISWSQESELVLEAEFSSAELFPISGKWGLLLNGEKHVSYLVGDFDGSIFAPLGNTPSRLDLGNDNSAGTVMKTADRSVYIGWMNHTSYKNNLPTTSWKSALTLPRLLSLDDENQLFSFPIDEKINLLTAKRRGKLDLLKASSINWYSFELNAKPETMNIMLSNPQSEKFLFRWDASTTSFTLDRSLSGLVDFNSSFSKNVVSSYSSLDSITMMDVFIDRSSVEIFINNGQVQFSSLVFPKNPFNTIDLEVDGNHKNIPATVYDLEGIAF